MAGHPHNQPDTLNVTGCAEVPRQLGKLKKKKITMIKTGKKQLFEQKEEINFFFFPSVIIN